MHHIIFASSLDAGYSEVAVHVAVGLTVKRLHGGKLTNSVVLTTWVAHNLNPLRNFSLFTYMAYIQNLKL